MHKEVQAAVNMSLRKANTWTISTSVRQVIFYMHQIGHSRSVGISIDGQGIDTNQMSCAEDVYIHDQKFRPDTGRSLSDRPETGRFLKIARFEPEKCQKASYWVPIVVFEHSFV